MPDFSDYVKFGWAICGIDSGSKSPRYADWNTNPLPADACEELPGAGLLHALSGTCALDIDNLETARAWLAERGVDVDALLGADDAVKISSGRPNRAKLLYRLSKPLRTIKPDGQGLELRCATVGGQSVQDVLPGTIHPDTKKPYTWEFGIIGDWKALPAIPSRLLAAWRAESAALATVDEVGTGPKMGSDELRKLLRGKSPDTGYDAWLRVGMALHDATGGAAEGLRLWNEWSKPGKTYKGEQDLYVHWVSFQSAPGKQVVTADSLKIDTVADPEDFEIVEIPKDKAAEAPEIVADRAAVKATRAENKTKKSNAIDYLAARLVFVRTDECYFDLEDRSMIGSDNAVRKLFKAQMPSKNGAKLNPVTLLEDSKAVRIVRARGFVPGSEALFEYDGETFVNTFRPNRVAPIPPMKDELDKIDWIFNRIDDPEYRHWIMQFYAHAVQFPGVKIKSMPLIWSKTQRNGKSTIIKTIPKLLVGRHYSNDVTSGELSSDFNDFVMGAWHLNLAEFRAGTRGERTAIATKLKNWIADDDISVHPKGKAAFTMPNHFFMTASSNEDDAAAIDDSDERWGVHELNKPKYTPEERQWIYHEFLLTTRAAPVLRHFFLNFDVTGFDPAASAIKTAARNAMIATSAGSDIVLLEEMFERRESFFARDVVLSSDVADHVQKHSAYRNMNSRQIGRILTGHPFHGVPCQFRVGMGRYRGVILRNMEKWVGAPGKDIMAHINGDDPEISVDHDPLLD